MDRANQLAALPPALVRALRAFRDLVPPTELVQRVMVNATREPREAPKRVRSRATLLFGFILAILLELDPLALAFAQAPAPLPAPPGDGEATSAEANPQDPTPGEEAGAQSVDSTPGAPAASDNLASDPIEADPIVPDPIVAAATGDTTEASAEAAEPDVRVIASPTQGVRVEAPNAANFWFEAHIAAWARFEVEANANASTQDYFTVPLVRPLIQASAFNGLFRLLVQPELAGASPRLLDLHLDFVPDPAFAVRVGQFRTPFSRAFINPIVQLTMPDRGVVSDTFRADRDTGLMLFGRPGIFEYDVGVFNGSGIDGRLGDTPAPMVVGRVALTPYGAVPYDQVPSLTDPNVSGFAIGANGYFRERNIAQSPDPEVDQRTASVGLDLSLVHGVFSFFGEGFLREQSTDSGAWTASWGAFAQAGVFVVPQILELSARAGWIDPDTELGGDLVQTYEANVAGYFYFEDAAYGHHLKLNLRYLAGDTSAAFGSLPAGTTHRVTVQLQVWM